MDATIASITWIIHNDLHELKIDEAQFEQIQHAACVLEAALSLEEKFDLLLANFAEYEHELLQLALAYTVDLSGDWTSRRASCQTVNRRIANFLSASRLYLEQIRHDIRSIFKSDGAQLDRLDLVTHAFYDNVLAYRFFENLRNHVQHQSLPLADITYPIDIERSGSAEERWRFSVAPILDMNRLRVSRKRKVRDVVNEVMSLGFEPNVTLLLRTYVECLCRIHEDVRAMVEPIVYAQQDLLDAFRQQAHVPLASYDSGFAIVIAQLPGGEQREFHIVNATISQRQLLRRKNQEFVYFAKRYVASERCPPNSLTAAEGGPP